MPKKGFFASLFDLSFTSFVTTKIIKGLYLLTLVLIGLGAVAFVVAAFDESTGLGIVTLFVLAPLGFLLCAIYSRVILEFLIAVFRIMETNTELVFLTRQRLDGSSTAAVTAGIGPQSSPPSAASGATVRISDDGEYWWDGSNWRSLRQEFPPDAVESPDGREFYDGTQWRPIPGRDTGGTQSAPGESAAEGRTVIEPDADDPPTDRL